MREDLAQDFRVGLHALGQQALGPGRETQPLVPRAQGELAVERAHKFVQPERGGLRHARAGLDDRVVERLVDGRQQLARGAHDGIGVAAHLRVGGMLRQDFAVAEHDGQRRAELVAHGGEEVAFRAARALGGGAGGLRAGVGAAQRDRVGDLVGDEGQQAALVFAEHVRVVVILHGEHADGAAGDLERHAQPDLRRVAVVDHGALGEHPVGLAPVEEQRAAAEVDDVGHAEAPERPVGGRVVLVLGVDEAQHLLGLVDDGDVEIFRADELPDDAVGALVERAERRRQLRSARHGEDGGVDGLGVEGGPAAGGQHRLGRRKIHRDPGFAGRGLRRRRERGELGF